jgi:hypothetical protein
MRTILVLIALFALLPSVLHWALTPFALNCKPDFFQGKEGRYTYRTIQYDHCDFGLSEPLNVFVSMLASGDRVPVMVALILLLLVAGLGYLIWRGFRKFVWPLPKQQE